MYSNIFLLWPQEAAHADGEIGGKAEGCKAASWEECNDQYWWINSVKRIQIYLSYTHLAAHKSRRRHPGTCSPVLANFCEHCRVYIWVKMFANNLLDFNYIYMINKINLWEGSTGEDRSRSSSWSPPLQIQMKLWAPKRSYYSHSIKSNQPYSSYPSPLPEWLLMMLCFPATMHHPCDDS